ncbi:hypothetical protein Tco_0178131 [Tanacetum coccineum]
MYLQSEMAVGSRNSFLQCCNRRYAQMAITVSYDTLITRPNGVMPLRNLRNVRKHRKGLQQVILNKLQKDKDMQKSLTSLNSTYELYKTYNNNLRTSSNTRNKNVDTTPRYKNDNHTGQVRNHRAVNVVGARETRKTKTSLKIHVFTREKMLLCKQAEKGVQLQAEQSDWLADTDEEIDEQELEAHYSYMAKIQEVPNADSGTDAEPLEQDDQNDVECDDEHVALANLIANLKLDVDENKKIQKQLKKANATLIARRVI